MLVLFQAHPLVPIRFSCEGYAALSIEIDSHEVTETHLRRCHQAGQWKHKIFLDGSLQMTSSILCVGAFLQQKVLDAFRAADGGKFEIEHIGPGLTVARRLWEKAGDRSRNILI